MDAKGKVLLQRFSKSKMRNGTKTTLEPIFFFIYSQVPIYSKNLGVSG